MTANNGKGVIFDLDGVLVDTTEFHKQSWYDVGEKEGFEMSEEFFYRTFGTRNDKIIPHLVEGITNDRMERLSQLKEERYRELIKGKLELLPGVKALLEDLKAKNFLTAIGSSTPQVNLDLMLEDTNTHDYFDALVCGGDVTESKPAPETFLKAAQKLSLSPAQCVVVEDATQGIQAGKAAGMAVVAVTTTRPRSQLTQADVIVDSLTELDAGDFEKLIQ